MENQDYIVSLMQETAAANKSWTGKFLQAFQSPILYFLLVLLSIGLAFGAYAWTHVCCRLLVCGGWPSHARVFDCQPTIWNCYTSHNILFLTGRKPVRPWRLSYGHCTGYIFGSAFDGLDINEMERIRFSTFQ